VFPPAGYWSELAGFEQDAFLADRAKTGIGFDRLNPAGFGLQNLFQPFQQFQFQDDRQLHGQPEQTAGLLELSATTAVMEAEMADAHKTAGQDMGQEAADKLHGREGHLFELVLALCLVTVVIILEGNLPVFYIQDAVVADGDPENVATEIFDQLLWSIERGLDEDFPILLLCACQHPGHIQLATLGIQVSVLPQLVYACAKRAAKVLGKFFC